jgi:hypothetical protein
MGRNHFSQQGGPYFINDGFSKHSDNEPINQLNKGFFYFMAILLTLPLAAVLLFFIL